MSSTTYLNWGMKTVDGWLNPLSAQFIAGLSAAQRKLGITGSVGEIGVHHGKLFILMHCDADHSRSFAIDVFDDQHLNTDQSGKGSYNHFVRNVRRWCGTSDNVEIIKRSSLDVKPSDIKSVVGDVRLFSIDGGHTEECTLNDLRLAEATVSDHGVVVIDDVYNQQWPGVLTGLARYLTQDGSTLRPFAFTPGKVYLAKAPAIPALQREMAARFGKFWDKDAELFDSRVDIYGIYEMNTPIKQKTKRALERLGLLEAASRVKGIFIK
jgi:hypothetical protein